ncbi:hypothetical protein SAMN04488570_2865 [Nocardioides scoriae]|uniref:Uncharacterized protein n=1 Tax=Nocardioides scoriae TaxID=642780 RepID=A0A1H1VKH7_9ACTN|nr:hypothetical protein [Nocardioides scoriae]SDS85397.1 hypothetical protein SAMN04488570_2865 [Nocardioides scoriae]
MRNRVIHRGYRPAEDEAEAAIAATERLETPVMDRLSAKSDTYPRAALMLVGKEGLERRDMFGAAKAAYRHESLAALLHAYNSWLDSSPTNDLDD